MLSEAAAAVGRCFASEPSYAEAAAGLPEGHRGMGRLGDLLEAHYRVVPAREQLRRNLLARRAAGSGPYPGLVGYEDTVQPALDRAILAGHDVLLVGQAGQAKTLLARTIAETLLSPMPVVRGSVTNDCPLDLPRAHLAAALDGAGPPAGPPAFHASPDTLEAIRNGGLETPIEWRTGAERYRYVLATPDLSVKDLVGYVDAVRVARRGTEAYRVEAYSPGQLMQAKHGLLCIDELPVLDPKKQVALLSMLQDGTFTTGAFPVAFAPRAVVVATANPVDYTHSGRIVEPLSDRLRSHIRTHYPREPADEMSIMLRQARLPRGPGAAAGLPAEPSVRIVALALAGMRASPHIDQSRGVSTRIGIHGLEVLAAEAARARGLPAMILCAGAAAAGEGGGGAGPAGFIPVPRLADLHALWQAAKFDLAELDGTDENRREVFLGIVDEAVRTVSAEVLGGAAGAGGEGSLERVRAEFGGAGGGEAPVFRVSQHAVWEQLGGGVAAAAGDGGDGGGDGGDGGEAAPYSEQLARFPALARMVEGAVGPILARHASMCARAGVSGWVSDGLACAASGDLRCLATELLLEALRWSKPKVLERRDGRYAGA